MGKFSMIACGLSAVGSILLIVALIVNVLSYYEESGTEVTYGATEASSESDLFSITIEYADGCDDGTGDSGDDWCSIQSRGLVWIIFLVIGVICGLIGAAADSGKVPAVSFGGAGNKFVPIVGGVFALIAILVWSLGNPAYDNSDDLEAGASIWLAWVGTIMLLVAGGLEFMGGGAAAE